MVNAIPKKITAILFLCFCCYLPANVLASCLEFDLSNPSSSKTEKWLLEIQTANSSTNLNISNRHYTEEQIIKSDKITLSDGSSLIFKNFDLDFWAIVAREIVFDGANISVRRDEVNLPKPSKGMSGESGKKGNTGKRDGAPGTNGQSGGPGQNGMTVDLPCLLVIANKIVVDQGTVNFMLQGVNGGPGGDGGDGGNGGDGGKGRKASASLFECKRPAGDGGRGGDAGIGGIAGIGGKGGNGGDVIFLGKRSANDMFQRIEIQNEGGAPGLPGNDGKPGTPGKGGHFGDIGGRVACIAYIVKSGEDGVVPGAVNQIKEEPSAGQTGKFRFIEIADVSPLF